MGSMLTKGFTPQAIDALAILFLQLIQNISFLGISMTFDILLFMRVGKALLLNSFIG